MTTHRAFGLWIFAAFVLGACGLIHEQGGSETHFLVACADDAECGPLSCRAGVCTLSCDDDDPCSLLSPLASCIADSVSSTCQVACTAASQCTTLGADFECTEGLCAPPSSEADTETPDEMPIRASDAAVEPDLPSTPTAIRGCDLETGFPDDDLCLPAPAPEDGIQLHLGPSRYDDSSDVLPFVLNADNEVEHCWSFEAPNTTEIAYAQWESSARMGQHHAVVQIYAPDPEASAVDLCDETAGAAFPELIGELPVLISPRMQRAELPPENTAVAFRIPAGARIRVRLHSFNFTKEPLLRELWVNLYFSAAEPVQYAGMLQAAGGVEWSIAPGSELTAQFECPIANSGRLLGLRASMQTTSIDVWLRRADGDVVKLLQQTVTLPETFLFDTITQNPEESGGFGWSAHSGPVSLEPGDTLQWQCLLVNDGAETLELGRGATCGLIGTTTGGDISCARP